MRDDAETRRVVANIFAQTDTEWVIKATPDDPAEFSGGRFALKAKILGLQKPTLVLLQFITSDDDLTLVQ